MPSTLLNTDKQTNGAILNKAEETNATAILDQQTAGEGIEKTISPNNEARVFFFDIDNCLYPKDSGIPDLMREKIEQYFRDAGIENDQFKSLSYRYYLDYGLAIRGIVIHHPEVLFIDVRDYDTKVDGALPLEEILSENPPLREMIKSMKIEKKWLFTNAGKAHALRVIKILGLEGLFDGLTYCDYTEPNFICKPEAASFRRAMKDAGVVHPSNCFFVDDSAANVDKALDIGWTAVHVADDPVVSKFGHYQISNILELPTVLPEFWDEKSASAALAGISSSKST